LFNFWPADARKEERGVRAIFRFEETTSALNRKCGEFFGIYLSSPLPKKRLKSASVQKNNRNGWIFSVYEKPAVNKKPVHTTGFLTPCNTIFTS